MQKVSVRVPLLTWYEFDKKDTTDLVIDKEYLWLIETREGTHKIIRDYWDGVARDSVLAYSDMSIDGKAGMFAVAKIGYKQAMLDLVSVLDANPDDDAKLREELMMLAVGNLAEVKNEE